MALEDDFVIEGKERKLPVKWSRRGARSDLQTCNYYFGEEHYSTTIRFVGASSSRHTVADFYRYLKYGMQEEDDA
jgi:hypothetical protein